MRKRLLLVLWLTGRCNLQCTYCYASENTAAEDMRFETARKILDTLREYPLKIQFAGGEPLLNFGLAEQIIAYVREQGIDAVFQLQTNGTLIDRTIAAKLKRYGISTGVSLDGIPSVNRLTRGRTKNALQGIGFLAEQQITIGLNAVVTAANVKELPKLVDFAFYLGNVGGIGLDLLRRAGRGREESRVSAAEPELLAEALEAMQRRSLELEQLSGRKIQIREIEQAKKRLTADGGGGDYCYASCGRSLVVLPDGALYPCGSLLLGEYRMGTVETFQPRSEDAPAVSVSAQRAESCTACRYRPFCPGGCPSRGLRGGGDLDCVLLKTAFALAEKERDAT
ncbi:MAG: radical SAM protein [Eubacteriales bacterium]|nr:radical SAM protein [Eubacteriales bacterium]